MRFPVAIGLVACLAPIAVVLGACGGGGELSRSETIDRAGAICRDATAQARQFAAGRKAPSNPDEVKLAVEEDVRIAKRAESRLEKLDPASQGRKDFDRFVDAQGRIVTANSDQLEASGSRDQEKFQRSVEELLSATGDAKKAADAYGIDGCPYRPVSTQFERGGDTQSGGASAPSTGVVGRWSGRVTQYGPGKDTGRYEAAMTITSDVPGSVAGTIEYPSFPCTGELQLSGNQDGRYVYRERIISGRANCFDGGTVVATVSGDRMSWRWVAKNIEVLGVLRRQT